MTLAERFWSKVDHPDANDCWPWLGAKNPKGYGRIKADGGRRTLQAHRVAYELLVGPIPDGHHLDHLCRNRGCVNPSHAEPVTPKENIGRGLTGHHMKGRGQPSWLVPS